jgi:hypothetical protein
VSVPEQRNRCDEDGRPMDRSLMQKPWRWAEGYDYTRMEPLTVATWRSYARCTADDLFGLLMVMHLQGCPPATFTEL